jgi:hypothetical protein
MKRELLRPKADLVFKRIFGKACPPLRDKEIAIEFINLIIYPPHPVVDLEFLPQEMLPDVQDGKVSIVDVRCIDSIRQQFI